MKASHYPEGTGPNDPEAPWTKTRELTYDEILIQTAIGELDELVSSLRYLDRSISPNSHFTTDAYGTLQKTRAKLQEMLTL